MFFTTWSMNELQVSWGGEKATREQEYIVEPSFQLQFLVAWKRENHRLLWGKVFFWWGGAGERFLLQRMKKKTAAKKPTENNLELDCLLRFLFKRAKVF